MIQKRKTGLTLLELLISMILIGIVMGGVLSFSLVLKRLQDNSDKSTVVVSRLLSAFARLSSVASQAIGNASAPGFQSGTGAGGQTWVSVCRDDVANTWLTFYISGNTMFECAQSSSATPNFSTSCSAANSISILNSINTAVTPTFNTPNNAGINVDVEILYDANRAHDTVTNPRYRLNGYFSSLAISL